MEKTKKQVIAVILLLVQSYYFYQLFHYGYIYDDLFFNLFGLIIPLKIYILIIFNLLFIIGLFIKNEKILKIGTIGLIVFNILHYIPELFLIIKYLFSLGIQYIIYDIADFIGIISFLILFIVFYLVQFKKDKDYTKINKNLFIIFTIANIIYYLITIFYSKISIYLLLNIIITFAFPASLFILNSDTCKENKKYIKQVKKSKVSTNEINNDAYSIDIFTLLLLILITCGIYSLVWIYKVTKELNKISKEYRDPTSKLLLCIFVPFYVIYWFYKTAEMLDDYKIKNKLTNTRNKTLILVLSIFLQIGAILIIQDNINSLYNQRENNENNNELDNIEAIKKYKELLDMEAITEEEFNKKKKELLK